MIPPATSPGASIPSVLVRLAGFFAALRERGLTVGVGAEVDLGQALGHVDILDREGVFDGCRATLAKSPSDLAILNRAFGEYWSSPAPAVGPPGVAPKPAAPTSPPADGRSVRPAPPAAPPTDGRPTVAVRFGVYSPEAPPAGHPLRPLPVRELAALRSGARRFRRTAATWPGRRYGPARRGLIDFRRTARRAVRSEGEWLDLVRRRKRRQRAEIVVLWDVSGSMRDHDDRLAGLVYAFHRVVRRLRVFAFSTELAEVTGLLAGNPYPRALAAIGRLLGPAGGGTRLGDCLAEFRRRSGWLVHRRTTVLVMSDGWDLGPGNLVAREVRWLRSRAHILAWVNPYARDPGFRPTTTAMQEALPHIDLLLAPADFERAGLLSGANLRGVRTANRPLATVAND